MTLGTLLPSSFGPHKPIHDRGEHIYHSPSWKGGSKGEKSSQSALSALTLLAFLFFLNILQSCLRDQMASQSPIVIMMTTTTTTTTSETHRQRRDLEDELKNMKGETAQLNQKTNKEDVYRNQSLSYKDISPFGDFETYNEIETKTSKGEIINKINVGNKLKIFNFSPWLQSIICCKILSCQNKEIANQAIISHYGFYIRKAINRLCQ